MKANIKNDGFIIDTGLVEFRLPFDRGEEKIYFNPNDTEFFDRMSNMINELPNVFETASEKREKADGDFEAERIIYRETNEKIRDLFDIAFGNSVSKTIFKYCSPTSLVKSKKTIYPIYILEYLMPLINNEVGNTSKISLEELERANSHIKNYV